MPVDTTKVITPRRSQKKLTAEELKEIERRRLLGELSCAECRRLKLRCDKKLPCGSCFRRGCESICPLGILAAGQGTRFILADTEQLHEKIHKMSNRIRQLEDALAILQSTISDQQHPLMSDELLKIKFGSEVINARDESAHADDSALNKSIDALGTLTLGSSGEMRYFGRSAGSETLMMSAGEEEGCFDDDKHIVEDELESLAEVERLASPFPFAHRGRSNVSSLELLETFLPSLDKASQLCDSFIKHGSFFFRPIIPAELLGDLLPSVYQAKSQPSSPASEESRTFDINMSHTLATLYFIFAIGSLLDLTLPAYNSEAEKYYDLGRATISLKTIYETPTLDSIRALGLMATYHTLAGKKYSRDSAWYMMSCAAKLAQSIGLHRDSVLWGMDSKTVQARRNLFWEVFSADVSHSLALGRPPALHVSYVDCEFPEDTDESLGGEADNPIGFWRMKHVFARDIYNPLCGATLVARSPSYNTILDLDKKVRESFSSSFIPYVTRDAGLEIFHSSTLTLRDFYASQNKTVTMLYLHRSYFSQAMLDHPANPFLSPFAPSFLTAYRSASVIIKASAHLFDRCAAIAKRVWFLLYHVFSAAVIVGTVVTRSPNSNIAVSAMNDFNIALNLFERSSSESARARIALGILLQLNEKAVRAFKKVPLSSGELSTPSLGYLAEDIEDELAIFGGQMKFLDRKGKSAHQKSLSSGTSGTGPLASPTSASPPYPDLTFSRSEMDVSVPEVHPALISFLNRDNTAQSVNDNNDFALSGLMPLSQDSLGLYQQQQGAMKTMATFPADQSQSIILQFPDQPPLSRSESYPSMSWASTSASLPSEGRENPSHRKHSSWQFLPYPRPQPSSDNLNERDVHRRHGSNVMRKETYGQVEDAYLSSIAGNFDAHSRSRHRDAGVLGMPSIQQAAQIQFSQPPTTGEKNNDDYLGYNYSWYNTTGMYPFGGQQSQGEGSKMPESDRLALASGSTSADRTSNLGHFEIASQETFNDTSLGMYPTFGTGIGMGGASPVDLDGGFDPRWISFMREIGIMDTDRDPY